MYGLTARMRHAFLAFHRHAGVIAHMLARARPCVERRGLAAVRIARESNPRASFRVTEDSAPAPDFRASGLLRLAHAFTSTLI